MMQDTSMAYYDTAEGRTGITEGVIQGWRTAIRVNTVLNYHQNIARACQGNDDHDLMLTALRGLVAVDPGQYCFAVENLVRIDADDVRAQIRAAIEAATVAALGDIVAADPRRYAFAMRVLRHFGGATAREQARASLDAVFTGDAEDQALVLLDEAEAAYGRGEGIEAVAMTRRALSLCQDAVSYRPRTVIMVAGVLRRDNEEALRWCDLAAPHADDMFDVLHQKGFSFLLLNRQAEARRDLLASIALAPERMSSWYVLGQYYRLRFEEEPALECYWRVRNSTDPLRVWAGLMIGYTHLLHGRFKEALVICDAVGAEHPWMKWALIMRGIVHLRAGEIDAAARAIDDGRRGGPDTDRARVFSGLVKLARRQPVESLADFTGECGDFACHALPRLGRARAMLELNRPDEAMCLVTDAVREESQWIAVTLRLMGPLADALMPMLRTAGFVEPSE